jgi:ribosomal protein S13
MGFKIKQKSLIKVYGLGLKKISFIFNEIGVNNKKKNFLLKFSASKKIKTFTKKFSFSDTLRTKIKRVISNKIKI